MRSLTRRMVNSYNKDGSLCTWSNPEHFVCQGAVQDFSSAVMYGVLGTRNMYTLYPVIPWSMFIGTVLGISIAISQRYAPSLIARWKRSWREERFDWWNRKLFSPLGWVYWFNPPVFWSGANSTWSGGGNLSYHTNQMYFSFIFMYQIKRRYPAWFEVSTNGDCANSLEIQLSPRSRIRCWNSRVGYTADSSVCIHRQICSKVVGEHGGQGRCGLCGVQPKGSSLQVAKGWILWIGAE